MPLWRILIVANMNFNAIHENKILAKISEFIVVARFQTVLCQHFNVDINTQVDASALKLISDKISSGHRRSIGTTEKLD